MYEKMNMYETPAKRDQRLICWQSASHKEILREWAEEIYGVFLR